MSKESYKLSDLYEIGSAPITPRVTAPTTPRLGSNAPPTPRLDSNAPPTPFTSLPPSQFHSPSLSRSPLLSMNEHIGGGGGDRVTDATPTVKTPRAGRTPRNFTPRNFTPRFITPLGSPIRKALHLTKLDPQDAWLPITESRNGNAYYAAFHTLCSGIGIQALVLPVAFVTLGWTWAIICITLAFIWQLYTLYILVQLHESIETGLRYSRYLQLLSASFGERVSKILGIFPVMYLSAGTCVTLIVIGGGSLKLFFQTVCGTPCSAHNPPTTVEWYLIFTCAAAVLSQLPNLNSIAGVSLIGAITAVGYCTVIWAVSVGEGRIQGVSYKPVRSGSTITNVFDVFNALGIISFAFRGHNLILEIQATMPSSEKHPSRVPMWRGTQFAYALIAVCLYPLAIGGYWAYGQKIPASGMLEALFRNHSQDASRVLLGLASLFVVINGVSSFQIYGMPTFDDMESQFTTRWKRACPWWLRAAMRTFFTFMCFLMAVAFPFVSSLAGLVGGIALPITLAYPCFMWIKWKKLKKFSPMWCLNWFLGVLGMILSVILMIAGVYSIVDSGIKFNFFKPSG